MKLFNNRAGETCVALLFWEDDFNFQRSKSSPSKRMIQFFATVLLFVSVLTVVCSQEKVCMLGQHLGSVVGFSTNYLNKSCNSSTVFCGCFLPVLCSFFSSQVFGVNGKLLVVDFVCCLVFI